jgi:hypothetical protein
MLGRLRMSPDQAIAEYVKLAKQVFSAKKVFGTSDPSTYKAKNLREALQSMVLNATQNQHERMMEKQVNEDRCKTWVRCECSSI